MTAPIEEPLLRMPSRYCSKNAALSLSGQKNGLRAISSQSHLSRSIWCGPICTSAPRTVTLGNILRAMAPAATRVAASQRRCQDHGKSENPDVALPIRTTLLGCISAIQHIDSAACTRLEKYF